MSGQESASEEDVTEKAGGIGGAARWGLVDFRREYLFASGMEGGTVPDAAPSWTGTRRTGGGTYV